MAILTEPDWKYLLTESGLIRVIDKDSTSHEIEAIDMEISCPFFLNVANDSLFDKIELWRNYQATYKVFTAKIRPEDEKEFATVAGTKIMEKLKQKGGGNLFKVELISAEEK